LTWSDRSSKSARPANDFESWETVSIAESAQCPLVRCPTTTRIERADKPGAGHAVQRGPPPPKYRLAFSVVVALAQRAAPCSPACVRQGERSEISGTYASHPNTASPYTYPKPWRILFSDEAKKKRSEVTAQTRTNLVTVYREAR
jgi:hypothetical protein